MATKPSSPLTTGTHGAYYWLTTSEHELDDLLTLCPTVVLGKYLAVTSFDGGSLTLDDAEKLAGWETRGGISYSACVLSVETLPPRGGYDEWYVFGTRVDLGGLGKGNVFEARLLPGQVEVFVNFSDGFDLRRTGIGDLADLFWRQLEWIRPESYIADGGSYMTFVTSEGSLFAAVQRALCQGDP
jgi:hypothetical protein